MRCFQCDLPDNYLGHGDGIGSCDCPRCERCGGPPGVCNCNEDDYPDWPDDVACGPGCDCDGYRPTVDADVKGGLL